jgi:hypothetical protein
MTRFALICIVIATAACGKKDTGGAGGGGGKAVDVAPINAIVPAALKDKLVFEKRDIVLERGRHNTTYTLAAPKGWTQRMKSFGGLEPDRKDLGFFTKFDVGSNCDGTCEPKNWEEVANKVNFAPIAASGKVLKDEKAPGRRTMIAEASDGSTTSIVVAWWKEGESRYWTCTATLDKEIKDAAAAFEKACGNVTIDGDD